jgi:hypothetical protein
VRKVRGLRSHYGVSSRERRPVDQICASSNPQIGRCDKSIVSGAQPEVEFQVPSQLISSDRG